MMQNQPYIFNKQSHTLCRLFTYFYNLIKEFLRITVLNGLKYLTFEYLTAWEKLFFLICFVAASYNSFNFAMSIVEKWQTSPVITVMNPQTSFIQQDPFPAVTICNMNQAQYSKVKDFNVKSLNYAMLQKLCFQEMNYSSFSYKQTRSKNDSFANFIVKNTQSCSHMVPSCKYGSFEVTCSDLFREVLLDEGMCCSFNIVHPYLMYKGDFFMVRDYTTIDGPSIPLDWSPEKGYPKEMHPNFYPRMALGDGTTNGFTIVLNGDYDNYFCSSTNGPGFKVSLHNPIDTPSIRETGLFVRLGYETSFRVTPSREDAVKTLRSRTNPKERQCYFSDERRLEYFRHYTRHNCEMECDAQFMLKKCRCIPYHMPLLSNNVTACHVKHFDCVVEAEKDFVDPTRLKCRKDCLSNCVDISYYPKAYFAALDNNGFGVKNIYLRNMSKETLNKHAVLKFFFAKSYYRGNIKSPYIGMTEFLSQVGGLMSLMMGFSIISLVEMVYFFILKPLISACRHVFYKSAVDVLKTNWSEEWEMQAHQNQNTRMLFCVTPQNHIARPRLLPYNKAIEQVDYLP